MTVLTLINYTLSFLLWMVLGRIVLSLFIGDRQNIIMEIFRKATDPLFFITRKLFPFAGEKWVPALAIILIIILRIILIMVFAPGQQPS
jgi:uncharacterized protein YggT (Ycf19 family)